MAVEHPADLLISRWNTKMVASSPSAVLTSKYVAPCSIYWECTGYCFARIKQIPKIVILYSRYSRETKKTQSRWYFVFIPKTLSNQWNIRRNITDSVIFCFLLNIENTRYLFPEFVLFGIVWSCLLAVVSVLSDIGWDYVIVNRYRSKTNGHWIRNRDVWYSLVSRDVVIFTGGQL